MFIGFPIPFVLANVLSHTLRVVADGPKKSNPSSRTDAIHPHLPSASHLFAATLAVSTTFTASRSSE